jgi:hypothetical protein
MNLKLKQSLVAVALAGAFSVAHAESINLTEADFAYDLGTNPTDENAYFVTHDAGSFSDVYQFSLSELSDTVASSISLFLPGLNGGDPSYDITDQSIALFSDPEGDGAGGMNTQIGDSVFYDDESGILTASNVAAGSYYIEIAGNAIGTQGGVYQFAMNTAPVPEPETYALMLAGLGLLGFVGKRRLRQSSAISFA